MTARFWILAVLSFIATLLVATRVVLPWLQTPTQPVTISAVRIGEAVVRVGVADDEEERQQGLSGREVMAEDEGLLFVFSEPREYSFWMSGMKFPLDFVWIQNGKVVGVAEAVKPPGLLEQPEIVKPPEAVQYVLEVNAGWVEQNGVSVGDTVFFE